MLKFLIIVLCVYFLFRMFGRMFVVSSFNSINKKMQDEMKRNQEANQRMPEGHITIDPQVAREQKRKDDEGDFVDYEEVK